MSTIEYPEADPEDQSSRPHGVLDDLRQTTDTNEMAKIARKIKSGEITPSDLLGYKTNASHYDIIRRKLVVLNHKRHHPNL